MNLSAIIPVNSARRFSYEGYCDMHNGLTSGTDRFPLYMQLPNDSEIWVLKDDIGFHIWHSMYHSRLEGDNEIADGCTVTSLCVQQTFAEAVDAAGSWIKANFPQ